MSMPARAMPPRPGPLAGYVRLYPGRWPALESSRPDAAARLAPGRRAEELPALLGSVFTLCSHAHRFTAARAVAMAQGRDEPVPAADRLALQQASLREQALRIAQDWPAQLHDVQMQATQMQATQMQAARPAHAAQGGKAAQGAPAASLPLAGGALWQAGAGRADLLASGEAARWLEQHWLAMPLAGWLEGFAADAGWTAAWSQQADTALARMLRAVWPRAAALRTAAHHLHLPAHPQDAAVAMAALGHCMATQPGFCARPHLPREIREPHDPHEPPSSGLPDQATPPAPPGALGLVPDTGPWSRAFASGMPAAEHAGQRLAWRLADLLRLTGPQGAQALAHGALRLGRGEGLAWTEMARGLLLHWVKLDGEGPQARVQACHVLAPTEWNFHPGGVLAQALRGLQGVHAPAEAGCLAQAFDPCVAFEVITPCEPGSYDEATACPQAPNPCETTACTN